MALHRDVLMCLSWLTALWLSVSRAQADSPFPFLDPTLPHAQRVSDLIGRLTLEEKVAQLVDNTGSVPRLNITGLAFRQECDSGVGPVGYPQSIGVAATFNRTVAFMQGRGIGYMLRAKAQGGPVGLACFSPMMNIMRHPNWGRNHEGYGECPHLTGEMAFNIVQGMQGVGLEGYPKYAMGAATCKHFSAFAGPGNSVGIVSLTDADWFWNYLPHFERCVEAGALSMMCSYALHRYVDNDEVPAQPEPHDPPRGLNKTWYDCADPRALTTVLRDTWGMGDDAFVVSDCGGVHDANISLEAGCDMDCGSSHFPELTQLVQSGAVQESFVDRAVRRVLGARMRLGEFDPPEQVPFRNTTTYSESAEAVANLTALSLDSARQSLTLLKNEGMLPLDGDKLRTLAVVGIDSWMFAEYNTADGGSVTEPFPNAAFNTSVTDAFNLALGLQTVCQLGDMLGCYLDDGEGTAGVLNYSARQRSERVRSHEECAAVCFRAGFAGGYYGLQSGVQCRCGMEIRGSQATAPLTDCAERCPGNQSEFCGGVHKTLIGKVQCSTVGGAAGTQVRFIPGCFDGPNCRQYDRESVLAGVAGADAVVVIAGEGGMEGEAKDMEDLQLLGQQNQMVEDVLSLGRPTALVLFTCTPVNISHLVNDRRMGAILQAFYPQQMGGHAVVDALLGRYNPSGRLPYTWPASLAKPGGAGQLDYYMLGNNATYRYGQSNVLFPFAYGLSYTRFQYSNFSLSPASAAILPCDTVSVGVVVANVGAMDGAEVVQLYLRWVNPGQPTPKLQLVNFTKVFVPAGEQLAVTLEIDARRMALLHSPPAGGDWAPPQWWVFPGMVEVFIGGGQPSFAGTLSGFFTIGGQAQPVASCKASAEEVLVV